MIRMVMARIEHAGYINQKNNQHYHDYIYNKIPWFF